MKKLIVLMLTLALTLSFATVSMASTLGVNVSKGNSVSIEKDVIDEDPFTITGNFGINDQWLISVGYNFNNDNSDDNTYFLKARYEIVENLATSFGYFKSDNADGWQIDLRAKYPYSDNLAFTGKVSYTDDDGTDVFGLFAQAEYAVSDMFIPTFGFDFSHEEHADDVTYVILGMDFYPTENFFIYLDYGVNVDDSDDDFVYLGVEFAF
ncbi:MAG TPA: hypothetical protein PLC07_03250 [Bacillota bacterium]|nr:hypothetical protein [Bacillota bacterium]HPT86689.1 hypothetical protein [Bacillota bacterium]